jgi:XTP/dITP diphosphohydrolase
VRGEYLLATRSAPKAREIRSILGRVPGVRLLTPDEVGLAETPEEEGIEIHDTFEGNALAKARWFRARTGLPAIADDSGLEVDALGGAPGVRSKRFAPEERVLATGDRDRANNEELLERLAGVAWPLRTGRFVCVAALSRGPDDERHVRGTVEGSILEAPQGTGGFGYDPLFHDPELGRAFGALTPAEKEGRSHRGRAFRALARVMGEG